ncbi:MAG: hypothetical protein LIP03_02625 [Bacteroidales bacterium]|nr:hypothetical protein [Bacteroidales bacterium]
MKQIFILIIALVVAIQANAQSYLEQGASQTNVAFNAFDYKKSKEWKKYKTLRAVGWSALGVGVPTTLVGVGVAAFADSQNGNGGGPGVPFIVAGGILTVASVPLLISAYHYRSKARQLSLQVSALPQPTPMSSWSYSPTIGLRLTF